MSYQQPHGYGPHWQAPGYGQPPHPPPPPPKKTNTRTILAIGCGGFWVLVTLIGVLGKRGADSTSASGTTTVAPSSSATPSTPPRRAAPAPGPSELPWLATVKENCAEYRDAPNDIKRSAIFNAHKSFVRAMKLTDVRGTLTTISTNQGGSDLTLKIEVGDDVEFTTEALFAPVKKGSQVYRAAAEMREGQCVVFSADKLEPSSMMEMSKVCDTEYFANFTSLKPCP
ncbi:hypothetical protein [Chondromyces apiculatus]|uniref:Uncharacterized protein n=1 Tax=Chondromyces apiculatus DSM 436 TaxID=1192034 RepID=A0A017TBK6_9BACT|nr:hypothetical protein [Chondromyces apiculatus]EYF05991.1 Hypothetical protein CAP_2450 [Chondromyces apiculatus DSM 436]